MRETTLSLSERREEYFARSLYILGSFGWQETYQPIYSCETYPENTGLDAQ
ncbi:MAG: hypothetical protein U9Q91_05275 [Candidatus Marinimicrobia bacterium]|nr:hypothetical protein [Candidatus Neomarinimicrobiota bacterium]